jgi:hypothetical protein
MVQQNTSPFHPGSLEIDEQSRAKSGCFQVIDTLRQVFAAQAIGALQFDDELSLNHQVGQIFTHALTLIENRK